MDMLYEQFVDILTQNNDTQTLINLFQCELDKQGTNSYSLILNVLTSLDLEEQEAKKHWEQIILNWKDLSQQIGRQVSLQTAVCDYFSSVHCTLKSSKIIDIRLYEKKLLNTYIDKLTGLYNRHYSDKILLQEIALAKRHNQDLSLIFFDIDYFKDINDSYGHDAGDLFLRKVADIIYENKRLEDIACRFGGEEMLLFLRNTDAKDALVIGYRILKQVEDLVLDYKGKSISTTISGGLAAFPLHGETAEELLKSGDTALYQAKGAGRNTIALSNIDKRRCLRVELSVPIKMKEFSFNNEDSIHANAQDISLGGFSFQTDSQLKLDMKIQVEFQMPDRKPLILLADIVRIEQTSQVYNVGAALCYKQMDKSCQNSISAYVSGNGESSAQVIKEDDLI
jgi:diguanylate cyclase (GGDEF)-like protein